MTATRQMFRCESQGVVTYSDRACSENADRIAVAIEQSNSAAEEKATQPPHVKVAAKKVVQQSSIAEEQVRHKQRCQELAAALDAVAKKIWNDDSAGSRRSRANNRADHLHDQQQKLERERRDEKCH
ncbi:MAG TPA: DUF4124 domain-containing protein [Steroidobacteraceae bacterium]|nr:DUF4124 domain-containing protein [Steroidobacteraceae bacterium]